MQISSLLAATPLTQSQNNNNRNQALEAFKKQFYEEVGNIAVHPSQAGTRHSLTISDKGFEKMMAEPAERERVLSMIRQELGAAYPAIRAPAVCTINFDDNLEYSGQTYGSAYESNSADRSDRKRKKKAEFRELLEEAAEKRRIQKKFEDQLRAEDMRGVPVVSGTAPSFSGKIV